MKIAVCDDCREDILRLRALLEGHDVGEYACAETILADMREKKIRFDLYLLDIYIEGSVNGIELAGLIREYDPEAVICFVSTSNDFYREAYDLYAVQYLLKPVKKEDMNKLLERVSGNSRSSRVLAFKWRGITGSIPYEKILYISSSAHTVSIFCKDGTVQEVTGKLNEIADRICGRVFCRCHQSFVVNMYQVERMRGSDLLIAGAWIPVSRRYHAQIKTRYQEILFEEVD